MTLHNTIRDKIILVEGASSKKEVVNTMGRCDIVTDKEIIEVCSLTDYKAGLGRLYAYSESKTFEGLNLKARLHLYCTEETTFATFEKNIQLVIELCKGNVRLTFGNEGVFTLWSG